MALVEDRPLSGGPAGECIFLLRTGLNWMILYHSHSIVLLDPQIHLLSAMAISLADNRGPGLNIGMWIILVPTVMTVAAKIYTKWYTAKKIVADDILMSVALVSCNALQAECTSKLRGISQIVLKPQSKIVANTR